MRTLRAIILSSFLLLATTPVRARVFVQWSEPAIPSAASLGVKDLVVPWGPGKIGFIKTARERGFTVFAEAQAQDATAVARAAASNGLAGIIVKSNSSEPDSGAARELVQKLRSAHPGLSVLELDAGGKQPQIRGNLVEKRHGVLMVSSPTREPWIDSNVALVKFEQAFQHGQPPLFSFSWDLTDPLEQQQGPRAEDYALAVAEAGAIDADVIIPVHPNLQKGLANGNQAAWREWDQVKTYLNFYSKVSRGPMEALADVAVVTQDYRDTYEAMNLLARRNITFRVLGPSGATGKRLSGAKLAIVFSHPDVSAADALLAFARAGGTVLLVDQHGQFPWQQLTAVKTANGTKYIVGHGEIIESSQSVGNPDEFASKIRDLLRKRRPLIYLWNAVTTLACPYSPPQAGGMVLDLVNYAQEPLEVQVRVKGSFPKVRYETPEHGFYPAAPAHVEGGFTQFVVSHLKIGGRVYLRSKTKQPQ